MKLLTLFVITVVSYIFNDDPTPNPEFDKLDFWGRFHYYEKQWVKP